MKKITNFILAAALGLSALFALDACEEDNPKLNNDYKIYINGVDRVEGNKAVNQERMTAHEICAGDSVALVGHVGDGSMSASMVVFTLANGRLDSVNNRIVAVAGNIESVENNPFLGTMEGTEEMKWIVTKFGWFQFHGGKYDGQYTLYGDTLAYIPTSQRTAIVDTLRVLFADGREKNIDKILEIFQTAFVFYPCTGAEYKELEAQGLN